MISDTSDRLVDFNEALASSSASKNTISLDVAPTWLDKPYLSKLEHLADLKLYKVSAVKTLVLSFSDPKELDLYNQYQTQHRDDTSNLIIEHEKLQWSDKDNNWKVLMKLVYLKYLSLI